MTESWNEVVLAYVDVVTDDDDNRPQSRRARTLSRLNKKSHSRFWLEKNDQKCLWAEQKSRLNE